MTLETRYGVPTVAVHTDKFERVVRSVAQVNGMPGLRQVFENVLQLRGAAGPRQTPGRPRAAFSHVYGAPGISACTVLTR